MANMSYCRFRNTLEDLQDCYDNASDYDSHEEDRVLSKDEKRAFVRLVKLCKLFADDYYDQVE